MVRYFHFGCAAFVTLCLCLYHATFTHRFFPTHLLHTFACLALYLPPHGMQLRCHFALQHFDLRPHTFGSLLVTFGLFYLPCAWFPSSPYPTFVVAFLLPCDSHYLPGWFPFPLTVVPLYLPYPTFPFALLPPYVIWLWLVTFVCCYFIFPPLPPFIVWFVG